MPLCTTPPRVWEGGGGHDARGEAKGGRLGILGAKKWYFSAEETRNFFTLRSVALWMEAAPPFGRGWPPCRLYARDLN